ncbi:acetylornithine aminotransferase [Pluteus cervinus]|uniref:Acetylornithine aminotransferase n=1 Tax=Pluteus cervinus TaxID=181527 RepID=A0ACD3BEB4_9AGAR|nr:acetylornithine aminotransferase [Pluteus cervinus]
MKGFNTLPAGIARRGLVVGRNHVVTPRSRYFASSSIRLSSEASPYPLPDAPSTRYIEPTHNLHQSEASTEHLARSSEYILPVYARPDFILSHGKGSYVWDTDGRKFLDFSAGIAVNALGHADEGVLQTITEQAGKLLHTSNAYHHEWSGKLGELLVTQTQKEGGLGFSRGALNGHIDTHTNSQPGAKVFFSNSGTEANEGALKIARKVGKDRWAAAKPGRTWDSKECTKTRIACFEHSFHGRSMGALSVTINPKYQAPFEPLIPGVDVGRLNDMDGLEKLVGQDTCAVIVEPIQGEGGVNPANVEWLRALRKRCDEVGAVLIFDEIQCGLYRSGTLWAHSPYPVDCHPDIVTMAKPLANGYPIGAVMMRDSVAATMTVGAHGTTFGGSPLACAVGYHVLARLSNRATIAQVAEISAYLQGRLELLPKWFPNILQPSVRGRGLILGLGFKDEKHPGRVVSLGRERGLFVLTAGKDAVRIVPSLTVGKEEVDIAVDVLESCLEVL